ncbi:hypothetical protein CEK29_21585 [Bordetella genomosp. 5]|uniref:SnoaL-like domain-containing protein n=1 Tax=Bordetella genomosp. 5 TaxID=1395608 RepID=A0A261SZZ7_9BORD|nr:hypothetical protein [Bordetella genomosp. 5]OZI33445.1 hypothetical protein CEK29_21585 [Bordetella genomosp. 5]OZI42755.1 hypothetical protein CAL25_23945 [Bordetella genomosp. 5]
MTSASPATTLARLRDYFHAKDENRPHYMARTFAPNAQLDMRLNTQAIAFPPQARGLEAITDTLVRKFGQTYDNVYTFYLDRPADDARLERYSCDWFVGMTEKATGLVRVGAGRYDWEFQAEPYLARRLTISIDTMEVLPIEHTEAVLSWLTTLPYPWTDAARVVSGAPPVEALAPVMHWLRRGERDRHPDGGTA